MAGADIAGEQTAAGRVRSVAAGTPVTAICVAANCLFWLCCHWASRSPQITADCASVALISARRLS